MGLFSNIKSAIDDKSSMSVNSVSVLTSAFMTFIIGLTACFVLVYDVTYDGKVDTDMSDLAWFIVAGSSCILGSGLPKAYIDSRMKTRSWIDGEKLQVEMDGNEYLKSNRKVKSKKNTSSEEEMGES